MLKYHDKAKLAIESMDALFSLYVDNSEGLKLVSTVKPVFEHWKNSTREPFTLEDYYKAIDAKIAHLKIKPHSWEKKNEKDISTIEA